MKFKNILYVFLMVLFITLAYLFFDRGINTKSKIYVNYQEDSDVIYKVYLKDNNIYKSNYLGMNERYIRDLVDYIDIEFDYRNFYTETLTGFYNYDVKGILYVYKDDINESIWKKEYTLLDNKVKVINSNDIDIIDITDKVKIDYGLYGKEIERYINDYKIVVSGYLEVIFSLKQNFNFANIDRVMEDDREIKVIIPLSYDTFRIDVVNDNNKVDSYNDFSNKEPVNYLFLVFGAFSLSLGISFLALVIRNMIFEYQGQSKYEHELKKILNQYGDILVKVKKFHNKKKYNLIYVDSFKELMDVYDKVRNPISYREIKRNRETIFLIIQEDNAWIYTFSV